MTDSDLNKGWLLLVHQLPPKPTNLRVRTWRKLQKLGAVAIKNSVYVLPSNDRTFEDFQWLKQEIESAGGEAVVFRADAVEGATDDELITAFRQARDAEYSLITAEFDGLTGAIREQSRGGHLSIARFKSYEAELDKLHKELERIITTDFFQAANRSTAVSAYERCRKALLASQNRKGRSQPPAPVEGGPLSLAQFQGRRWVTRKNLFIDRLASVWLIKRFIDRRPRFSFVSDGERVEGGIRFDMYGAEFTHEGEDCTFETMIKRFGLSGDKALCAIAEVVHDIDLKDNKFNRLEAAGLNAVVRGLSELLKDDRELARQCNGVFDGLYLLLSNRSEESRGEQNGGEQRNQRRAGKRGRRPAGGRPG
jgi:hypothetical protein